MISIVICSTNPTYYAQVTAAIAATIGVPYELIKIDNTTNKYSIFEAYNIGFEKAQFGIVCYTHEDILFHTQDWGKNLVAHFNDKSIGLVGVIGATMFPKSPSAWWSNTIANDHLVNNIQHWTNGVSNQPYHTIISQTEERIITRDYNNPTGENVVSASVVDGLFFAVRRLLYDLGLVKFDNTLFKGFHCYDTDISLQVNQSQRVVVVFDILVEHLQQGTINKNWYINALMVADKWRNHLPFTRLNIDPKMYSHYESEVLKTFIYWMQGSGYYSRKEVNKVVNEYLPKIPTTTKSWRNKKELFFILHLGPTLARLHRLLP